MLGYEHIYLDGTRWNRYRVRDGQREFGWFECWNQYEQPSKTYSDKNDTNGVGIAKYILGGKPTHDTGALSFIQYNLILECARWNQPGSLEVVHAPVAQRRPRKVSS